MSTNPQYKVNEDGTVTRLDEVDSSKNNPSFTSDNTITNRFNRWVDSIAIVIIAIIVMGTILAVSIHFISETHKSDSEEMSIYTTSYVEDKSAKNVSVPSATYLRVSEQQIYMDAKGGYTEIEIETDGKWFVSIDPESWGHIAKSSNSLILKIDPNYSTSQRTDYFDISAGNFSRRIYIIQYSSADLNSSADISNDIKPQSTNNKVPSVSIENVSLRQNVYQDGEKGMIVYFDFTANNLRGKAIFCFVYLYENNNITPLRNQNGDNLAYGGYGKAENVISEFNAEIFVPYSDLKKLQFKHSVELSFDIRVKAEDGAIFANYNNNHFIYRPE